jgi:hypothetical protein
VSRPPPPLAGVPGSPDRLAGHSRLVYLRHGRLERLMGKVLWVDGAWVYRRDLKPDGLLRALNGFSTDEAVLRRLRDDLVDEVHYAYQGDLYTVTLERLIAKAIVWDKGGRVQRVLPRSYWTLRPDYPQEHIPESRRETVTIP